MRTRANRRNLRKKKIKQRERVLKAGGYQAGTMFDKHTAKIKEKGTGFMSKHGTLLHFANGTSKALGKTRDRHSYSGTNHWKAKDMRRIESMDNDERDAGYN